MEEASEHRLVEVDTPNTEPRAFNAGVHAGQMATLLQDLKSVQDNSNINSNQRSRHLYWQ